jgi:hypothetical protein
MERGEALHGLRKTSQSRQTPDREVYQRAEFPELVRQTVKGVAQAYANMFQRGEAQHGSRKAAQDRQLGNEEAP